MSFDLEREAGVARRLCQRHTWVLCTSSEPCECGREVIEVCVGCQTGRCVACAGELSAAAKVAMLRDPVTVAEVLVPALCRQLAAHGVIATPDQVAAIAANVAFAVAEAAK